jgi:hypothetical protein
MATPLASFYPYVRMDVQQVAAPVLTDAVLMAAQTFCEETWIYTGDLAVIPSVAGQASYVLVPPTGTDVVAIKALSYAGARLRPTSEDELDALYATSDWRSQTGSPRHFYQTADTGSVSLFPAPETASVGAIKINAALRPAATATTVPDFLYSTWVDAIAAGAKFRLFMMTSSAWGDPAKAAVFSQQFQQEINRAKALVIKGFGNRRMFVRPARWWGVTTNG